MSSRDLFNKSMKKKMGRPMLADSPKTVLVGARFDVSEAKRIEKAAKDCKRKKSEWIRETLLSHA